MKKTSIYFIVIKDEQLPEDSKQVKVTVNI